MALTKKEKAYIEQLLTETALRPTPDVNRIFRSRIIPKKS